jgi:DNA-binding NarL/FixJ family response regulator
MKRPIRIFIADDHRLMLEGLATLVESIEGFEAAGKFNSGRELIDALQRATILPDICIVDIEMPGMDGVETVKSIREKYPRLKIMALTMHHEWHFANRMISAGADGYILKNVERAVFIDSVNKILSGNSFITAGLTQKKTESVSDDLTEREKAILIQIVKGKSNKEIGEELFISDRTVDTHRTNIKRKLKLNTLSQLIQYAKEQGIS